jgi:glycosyltransferase involved in cell wall biosynthesis
MKVALLTDGIYPYAIGGMQKHSFYLAKYFAQNKITVHLYHCIPDKVTTPLTDLFNVEELPFIVSHVIPFPSSGNLPGHYLRESFQYACSIYNQLKNNSEVDFIYVQGFAGWKVLDAKRKGESFPPIGINFHGMEPLQAAPGWKAKMQKILLKKPMLYNIAQADVIFTLGENLSRLLMKQALAKEKICKIPICLEENWLMPQQTTVNDAQRSFVFVGRYERRKGIEELNAAIQSILAEENFTFHFIGPIPEDKQIKDQKIIYHGSIANQEQIKEILKKCDVLVCPSYAEGMPTVILEAFACGLSAIATDVGAVSELVNERTGILLPAPDVVLIKDAILQCIRQSGSDLQQKQKTAQKLISEKHLWSKIIHQTIEAIENAIAAHSTKRVQ